MISERPKGAAQSRYLPRVAEENDDEKSPRASVPSMSWLSVTGLPSALGSRISARLCESGRCGMGRQ